jgi:hypothetical protein
MSKATKQRKDKLQELADEQMLLPGLEYFVGRERGMHEMLTYARPRIEKLLVKQRKQWMPSTVLSLISRTNITKNSKRVEIR